MPEYLSHPVVDQASWEENVRWRLAPQSPERYDDLRQRMAAARTAAAQGQMITQRVIGGYMYLRSLMGPAGILYKTCEAPDLVHCHPTDGCESAQNG